jgi:hypothetical protein
MIQLLLGLLWVVLWALFHWRLVPPNFLGADLSGLVQAAGYGFFGGHVGGLVAFAVLILSAASALAQVRPDPTVANTRSTT